MVNTASPLLEARRVKKSFNRVEVLHGVDFTLQPGEIHGLVGQNGAGKSTLMKIINGVYTRDEGEIRINGQEAALGSPSAARHAGIGMVFQEFSLVPSMTVLQNLFLAREPLHGPFIDEAACRRKAETLFRDLEIDLDLDGELSKLAVGTRQIVEIAKALSLDASILILDEPTASLSGVEIQLLFKIMRKLKADGIGIIFVSHHLNEVIEICDRVTVLRDGQVALSDAVSGLALSDIITAMIGRKLEAAAAGEYRQLERGQPLLEVRNLSAGEAYTDLSFNLYPGEVLGLAGVLGSGRSELLKTLYGILPAAAGEVRLRGEPITPRHPADAIQAGIVLVPEDRRKNGLVGGQSIRSNVLLPIWKRLTRLFFIQDEVGTTLVERFAQDLKIRANSLEQNVEQLSGGNQQKVVFAKSLAAEPKVLLLDDPTVGVDIATKKEIAVIVRRIASEGNGVIYVSSEMDEVAALCDRVLVLRRGRLEQELIPTPETPITEPALLEAIQR